RPPSEEELYRWFARGRLNRGLVTGAVSGLVAIDADSVSALQYALTRWPTVMQTATKNGWHLWYRHPGVPVKNGVKLLGMPLDVRADGGYCVAPGSVVNGSTYLALGDWTDPKSLPVFDPRWVAPEIRPEPCPMPKAEAIGWGRERV